MHFRNGQEQGIGSMRKLFGLATIFMALFLVACDSEPPPFSGGTGDTGDGDGGTGAPVGSNTVFMGSGAGASFVEGVISISQTTLQAGGSASLTVTFVDESDVLVGAEITASFSSNCVAGGLANIVESSVITNTGAATSTYSATGCSGDDTITATANVEDTILQATGTVTVAAATVGSIEFVSADPTNIGLLGTGGVGRQETSTVRFKVTDSTGGPVSGSTVDFTLNTTLGGIVLTPTSVTSDIQGFAQTVISAGSVATSVRVTATVNPSSPAIATQSDQLTITTGIPDNDSVSLSMACVNIEGWNRDGETTMVTVRMSDRYNNPVPDGTAVTLNAEGGQVGSNCQTATTPADGAGVCSVTFVSSHPRDNGAGDGRVSILAFAIGEESFIDADADGVFNNADIPLEIGEPFRDDNESTAADTPPEFFADFNSNGVWDDATQPDYVNFNGLLCDSMTALCSPNQTLFVSDQGVVVMSAGAATILDDVGGDITLAAPGGEGVATFTLTIGDNKGNMTTSQPMASGTTVDVTTSNGSMVGPDSYDFLCSNVDGPIDFDFAVKGDTTASSGLITAEVTSPSGVVTVYSITFND
jgi:hypothetical protein